MSKSSTRCLKPVREFRDEFVQFVLSSLNLTGALHGGSRTSFGHYMGKVRVSWLATGLAGQVYDGVKKWTTVEVLGAWIEWAIERADDLDKKRVGSFKSCRDCGTRWHPEIRSWLENNRPSWVEATLASEAWCDGRPMNFI